MFYRGEGGTFQRGPADADTFRGLKQWKQAYEEGLLNPEFYTYTGSEDVEDFDPAFKTNGSPGAASENDAARRDRVFGIYVRAC